MVEICQNDETIEGTGLEVQPAKHGTGPHEDSIGVAGRYTPQERAILVTWLLADGWRLNLEEVSRRTGLTRRSARKLMLRICRVLPVSKVGAYWALID